MRLTVQPIHKDLYSKNIRTWLETNHPNVYYWNIIRDKVIAEHNNTCQICGYTPPAITPPQIYEGENTWGLEVHEKWEWSATYADNGPFYVQSLEELQCVCYWCHRFIHAGNTWKIKSSEIYERTLEHAGNVNEMARTDITWHIKTSYDRYRSLNKHYKGIQNCAGWDEVFTKYLGWTK